MPHLEQFPAHRFRYLRFCGVYQRPTGGSRFRVWYTVALHCLFIPLHSLCLVQHLGIDLMVICEEIMLMQLCMTALFKFNLFVGHRDTMYALVDAFKTVRKRVGEKDLHRFVRCNHIHERLTRIYITCTTIVATLYALNALSASVTLSLQNGELRFVTPMNFPYNYQHPLVFVLSFIYNVDTMVMTMCISATVDACYSEMANNLALHFAIVGERFAALDFSGTAQTERDLIELVAYHGEVLRLAEKMVRSFRPVVFFLLMMISTMLCVLGYEFVVVSDVSKRLQVVVLAVVMTSQAVIYTYNGSIISDQSAHVAEAIYAANWYEAHPTTKRLMQFCLLRAQKPVVMKGGFIEATLPTLKNILSSSGSYITMLLSLESDV